MWKTNFFSLCLAFLLTITTTQLSYANEREDLINNLLQDPTFIQGLAEALQQRRMDQIEQVAQSVVTIRVRHMRELDGRPASGSEVSLGSGFIVSTEGHIVTNSHVLIGDLGITEVETLSKMFVYTVELKNGTTYTSKVVTIHKETDLAILQIEGLKKKLPAITFGDSDLVQNGQKVCAVGSPLGFEKTVTCGVVSNPNQTEERLDSKYHDFIQTDTAINQGNSGGPLFDVLTGNVIGVNTIIASRTGTNIGLGFAIPSNVIAPWVKAVLSGLGGVERNGWIGITVVKLNPQIKAVYKSPDNVNGVEVSGLYVAVVDESGPSQDEIQKNDIILMLNGEAVSVDPRQFILQVQNIGKGEPITLTIFRFSNKSVHDVVIWTEEKPR